MIDRNKVRLISAEIDAALKDIANRHNIQLTTGGGTFSSNNFTIKVNGSAISSDGSVMTKEAEDFKSHAFLFGLKAEDLGKTFFQGGKMYEIVGCKPRSSKYPILAQCKNDGKTYKFTANSIKGALT
jgi:hypothetical protein